MILMFLLTELARLEVYLSVASDGLHVQAPVGVLTDELRLAMIEHKAALLRYVADPVVESINGLGYLTGNRQEQDVTFVAQERKEQLCYKVGVVILQDGIEHFYYPGMLSVGHNTGSDPSL
jgi:tubulysin polyketide synthase-like protein